MPAVSNFSNLSGVTASQPTKIVMDLKFYLDTNLDATYEFTKKEIAGGHTSIISITLVSDIIKAPNAVSAYIEGYCSTDIDPGNVAVIEHETRPPANTKTQVGKIVSAQLKAYPYDTHKILFEVVLQERQLVFIGVIVVVLFKDGSRERYLCDPQVGNGPPATSGFAKALPVV